MMDVRLHHRGVYPKLRAILQPELDCCPDYQVIDGFEGPRLQANEAALKSVVFRNRRAVKVGELTQRLSVPATRDSPSF